MRLRTTWGKRSGRDAMGPLERTRSQRVSQFCSGWVRALVAILTDDQEFQSLSRGSKRYHRLFRVAIDPQKSFISIVHLRAVACLPRFRQYKSRKHAPHGNQSAYRPLEPSEIHGGDSTNANDTSKVCHVTARSFTFNLFIFSRDRRRRRQMKKLRLTQN